MKYNRNSYIESDILPVDIVFHPSWWHKNTGIDFDEDFFYHPLKRVESEQRMEKELYERFGRYALGMDYKKVLPEIGGVHLAAGYLLSEMLGCEVDYLGNASPQVKSPGFTDLNVNVDKAFQSKSFKKLQSMMDTMKLKYGYLTGDINWGGVLNLALDLIGENILMDMFMKPEETKAQFQLIGDVIEKFVRFISEETKSSSISVNRNVRHIRQPVFLHSECSHTMIGTEQYEEFLMPIDRQWNLKFRPFGIHYCGKDPHRYAESFAKLPQLDFLDVGWGGDVKELRKHLPYTFLNIRLDPVTIAQTPDDELIKLIVQLVKDSDNPYLTGVCCINMDDKVSDKKVSLIFETVNELRDQYKKYPVD